MRPPGASDTRSWSDVPTKARAVRGELPGPHQPAAGGPGSGEGPRGPGPVEGGVAVWVFGAGVRESRDRVRAAIQSTGLEFPDGRITVNLAPADLPKDGGRFDLAIAVAILVASGQVRVGRVSGVEFLGELAFSGGLRRVPGLLQGVGGRPGGHRHQRDDGRIVLGGEDGPPPTHADRLAGHPNDFPTREIALEHANRMLIAAQRYVPDLVDVKFEDVVIGWRPMPVDGYPVLGASPARKDIYLAVMHSGVTLAPIVGELAAREITESAAEESFRDFRPDRRFVATTGH